MRKDFRVTILHRVRMCAYRVSAANPYSPSLRSGDDTTQTVEVYLRAFNGGRAEADANCVTILHRLEVRLPGRVSWDVAPNPFPSSRVSVIPLVCSV